MAQDHAPKIPIEQRKTRGPGPGTYDVRGGPTGASFVMGSRWKDVAYVVEDAAILSRK